MFPSQTSPMPGSPRGAFSRPASPSKSHATPLRRRLASPVKKILNTEFINNWTPTRMTTQLQNAIDGARKRRAWEREPRTKNATGDSEGAIARTHSRTIYKRFDPSDDVSTNIRQQSNQQQRATKKMRLSGQEPGAAAAWESPKRSLPHKLPTAAQPVDDQTKNRSEQGQIDDIDEAEHKIRGGENGEEDDVYEATAHLLHVNEQVSAEEDSNNGDSVSHAVTPMGMEQPPTILSEVEVTSLITGSPMRAKDSSPPLPPVDIVGSGTTLDRKPAQLGDATDMIKDEDSLRTDATSKLNDDASVEAERSDAPVSSSGNAHPNGIVSSEDSVSEDDESEVEPGHLRRILTPYNGSFKASELDELDTLEDSVIDAEPVQRNLIAQPKDSAAETTEAQFGLSEEEHNTTSPAILGSCEHDVTVTEALPARLFELQAKQLQSACSVIRSESQTDAKFGQVEESQSDSRSSSEPERVADTAKSMRTSPVVEDMFNIDIQSLRTARSPSPVQDLPKQIPSTDWGVEETTTTIRLNDDDDETVLRDFLNRSKASKAAKIARRSSLSNKRDSDVVRHALASPRKPLEEVDTNSPLMSPRQEKEEIIAEKVQPSPVHVETIATVHSNDDELAEEGAASTGIRRSGRSRTGKSQRTGSQLQRTITVRREDHLIIKRTEAQELSSLTRSNTRRNKGGSLSASATLKRLEGLVSEVLLDRDEHSPERRGVRWNDKQLVSFFKEVSRSDVPEDAVATAEADEPQAVSQTKPKVKRVKALGAVNGTPAKKKATRSGASEKPDTAFERSRGSEAKDGSAQPAQNNTHEGAAKIKSKAETTGLAPQGDKENLGQGQADGLVKTRAMPQRKSMVPRPRSSARLRKEA